MSRLSWKNSCNTTGDYKIFAKHNQLIADLIDFGDVQSISIVRADNPAKVIVSCDSLTSGRANARTVVSEIITFLENGISIPEHYMALSGFTYNPSNDIKRDVRKIKEIRGYSVGGIYSDVDRKKHLKLLYVTNQHREFLGKQLPVVLAFVDIMTSDTYSFTTKEFVELKLSRV